ncbi:MAG: GTP-binding protein [Synergistaceae bacterium]|nr:GTP-binding protein [Synergistaceae bacterium]
MKESKCKIFLLSGFLGSGKTTLLKHLLKAHPEEERAVVLMNEFGKSGVDSDVVRRNDLGIIKISSGAIFCACANGDFLRGLYTIPKDYKPTILLVEASGVADATDMKNAALFN